MQKNYENKKIINSNSETNIEIPTVFTVKKAVILCI